MEENTISGKMVKKKKKKDENKKNKEKPESSSLFQNDVKVSQEQLKKFFSKKNSQNLKMAIIQFWETIKKKLIVNLSSRDTNKIIMYLSE